MKNYWMLSKWRNALPNLVEGEKAKFDPATMLFVSSLDWRESGGTPEQLCKNISEKKLVDFLQMMAIR